MIGRRVAELGLLASFTLAAGCATQPETTGLAPAVRDVLLIRLEAEPVAPVRDEPKEVTYARLEGRVLSLQAVVVPAGFYCTVRAERAYDLAQGPMVSSRYLFTGPDEATRLEIRVDARETATTVRVEEAEDYAGSERFTRTETERDALLSLLDAFKRYLPGRYPDRAVSLDFFRS